MSLRPEFLCDDADIGALVTAKGGFYVRNIVLQADSRVLNKVEIVIRHSKRLETEAGRRPDVLLHQYVHYRLHPYNPL